MMLIESVYDKLLELYDIYNPRGWLWLVSYSGGKDSTALLLLTLRFARENVLKSASSTMTVGEIYGDPALAFRVLDFIRRHSSLRDIVGEVYITKPERSFFDYILTRYSPPRWNFRWCCKRLKEYPFKKLVRDLMKSRKVLNLVGNRVEEAR